jgi:hypothetical protein
VCTFILWCNVFFTKPKRCVTFSGLLSRLYQSVSLIRVFPLITHHLLTFYLSVKVSIKLSCPTIAYAGKCITLTRQMCMWWEEDSQ